MVFGLFKKSKNKNAAGQGDPSSSRRQGNIHYSVTRVRARMATLIAPSEFEKLVVYDVPQINRFMQESQYRNQIDRLGVRFKGIDLLEQALALHLSDVFTEILSFCDGKLKTMVQAYLSRYDALDIKNILRGIATQAPADDIKATLIAAGEHSVDFWHKLAEMETVEAVLAAIPEPYGNRVRETLKSFQRENHSASVRDALPDLEDTINWILFERLVSSVQGKTGPEKLYLEFVARNIDINNLTTLFVLKKEGLEKEEIVSRMLPGGQNLGKEQLRELAETPDFNGFLESLQSLPYWEQMGDDAKKVIETQSIALLETALRKNAAKWCRSKAKQHSQSVLKILEFILRKEQEVYNLRLLARGKSLNLDEETLRELLDLG